MCNKERQLCSTLPAENPEEYSLSKDIPPNLSKLFVNLLLGWLHILKQFPLSLVLGDPYNSAYIQTELYIYTLKIFKPNFSSSQHWGLCRVMSTARGWVSPRWDYGILSQGRWEAGMERGRLGRVRHMEFQKQNHGSKLKWRIEK